jgi:hypothetical protein
MMIEGILYISTLLISFFVVGQASDNGFLNGSFTRAFGGLSTQVVSATWLVQYTNFETFITGCIQGQVGVTGYFFILSLALLLVVWINNIFEYRQAIV